MNWKIIVGLLVIFGGIKELFAEMNDHNTGVTQGNPIFAELGCITFICLGIYLIFKGNQQRKANR